MMNSVILLFLSILFISLKTNSFTMAQAVNGTQPPIIIKPLPLVPVATKDCGCCSPPKRINYLVGTQKVTWWQAFVLCQQSGMELASITSKQEELAVEYQTNAVGPKVGFNEGYWLAGNRNGACNSDFVWFTTGEPMIYRNFATAQPDNSGGVEDCVELFLPAPNTFAWNDAPCATKFGYICQSLNACCCQNNDAW